MWGRFLRLSEIRKCSRFNFYSLYPLVNVKRSTSNRFIQDKNNNRNSETPFSFVGQETMDPGVVDSIFSSVVGLSKKAKWCWNFMDITHSENEIAFHLHPTISFCAICRCVDGIQFFVINFFSKCRWEKRINSTPNRNSQIVSDF